MNNVLTASRLKCAMTCLRQHFWKYEIGLAKTETSLALRIGSAWARAMEARWKGQDYDNALAAAIPENIIDLDVYSCATISALLAGYYDYYGQREVFGKVHAEEQFGYELGMGFNAQGKLDGLGSLADGRSAIVESKTTSDSIEGDSDYWLRLAFDMQCYQYIDAARQAGWDVAVLFYDVTRKPSIRPKVIDDKDKQGRVIVLDQQGKRVFIQQGKNKGQPRQSGDKEKGYVVKSHLETPDEYCDRLWLDTKDRPEFYFARREVPIIDQQVESFVKQREAIAKLILSLREQEVRIVIGIEKEKFYRDAEAWPRNVSENTCNFCSFKSFCLQNISVDINNPPPGFEVKPFNPELDQNDTSTTETTDTAS